MKKKLCAILIICLIALPVLTMAKTASASTIVKKYNFTSGITLNSGCTEVFTWQYMNKGDKVHFSATSTGLCYLGISNITASQKLVVRCNNITGAYITVPTSGWYRIFLYNASGKKNTISGIAYHLR